jgi:hypothetical protein
MSDAKDPVLNLAASAIAGACEATVMMPLDTIKTRAQLDARYNNVLRAPSLIVSEEGFGALYRGLAPLISGITPKVIARFSAFNFITSSLADSDGNVSNLTRFYAGLGAGAFEAIAVVTPFEMV